MSTYINPSINTNNPSPQALDAAIESIRQSMAGITWNAKSFGRAWAVKEKDLTTDKLMTIPKAYTAEGNYQNVLPNDTLFGDGAAASSFIAVMGDETYSEDFQPRTGNVKKADLAIIIWGNLKMIDSSKDYIFNEALKKDIETAIKSNRYIKSINSWTEEKADKVFQGYDLPDDMFYTEWLQYPYWGCRVELTVEYPEAC